MLYLFVPYVFHFVYFCFGVHISVLFYTWQFCMTKIQLRCIYIPKSRLQIPIEMYHSVHFC